MGRERTREGGKRWREVGEGERKSVVRKNERKREERMKESAGERERTRKQGGERAREREQDSAIAIERMRNREGEKGRRRGTARGGVKEVGKRE